MFDVGPCNHMFVCMRASIIVSRNAVCVVVRIHCTIVGARALGESVNVRLGVGRFKTYRNLQLDGMSLFPAVKQSSSQVHLLTHGYIPSFNLRLFFKILLVPVCWVDFQWHSRR